MHIWKVTLCFRDGKITLFVALYMRTYTCFLTYIRWGKSRIKKSPPCKISYKIKHFHVYSFYNSSNLNDFAVYLWRLNAGLIAEQRSRKRQTSIESWFRIGDLKKIPSTYEKRGKKLSISTCRQKTRLSQRISLCECDFSRRSVSNDFRIRTLKYSRPLFRLKGSRKVFIRRLITIISLKLYVGIAITRVVAMVVFKV